MLSSTNKYKTEFYFILFVLFCLKNMFIFVNVILTAYIE